VDKRATALRVLMVLTLLIVALGTVGLRSPGVVVAQDATKTCAGETPIGAPAASPAASPAAAGTSETPKLDKLNIAFLPKAVDIPYFDAAAAGAQIAATELGGQFKQVGPSEASAAEQVPFINTLIQQHVDAIVVAANDPNALAPSLKQARQQGVSVVSYDSDVAPDARTAWVNQASTEQIGRIEVQILGREINCAGQIAILSTTPTTTNQNAWIEFMKDELAKPGYEKMTLAEIAYGNDDPQKSLDEANRLLQAYPDLKGIISPTSIGLPAAAQAVRAAGKTEQISVTGLSTPNQMREYVKDGTVKEFALWDVGNLGYLAYYVAALVANDQLKGDPGETFTAGKLGSYTVGDKSEIVLGPPLVVTSDNIDQYNF